MLHVLKKNLLSFHHFLQEYLPVCSHRSCCSFLAFVLKGNHSVGADVPGSCLDLIKSKLEEILLEDNKKDTLQLTTSVQEIKEHETSL